MQRINKRGTAVKSTVKGKIKSLPVVQRDYKSKVPTCTTSLYNKKTKCYNKNKCAVYGIVQYSTLQLWQIYER